MTMKLSHRGRVQHLHLVQNYNGARLQRQHLVDPRIENRPIGSLANLRRLARTQILIELGVR